MLTVRFVLSGWHYDFRMPPKRGRKSIRPARYSDDVTTRSTTKRRRTTRVETAPSDDEAQAVTVAPPDIVVLNEQMAAMQQQIQSISDVVIGMATAAAAPPTECEETRPLRRPAAAAGSAATVASDVVVDSACVLGENIDEHFPWVMQSFSSVPLGSLVDPKIKAKIWAKQFVELELLAAESTPQTLFMLDAHTSKPVVEVRDQPTKRITNVEQWTDAFLLYIAIYLERHPADTADILKYLQIIRTMSANAHSKLFLSYDRNFRKLRARNSMPWCNIHQELFHHVTSEATKAQSQSRGGFPLTRQPFQRKQSFPAGYCYAFCATGRCRNAACTYSHMCPTCSGPHAPSMCPTKRTGQRPSNAFASRPAIQALRKK